MTQQRVCNKCGIEGRENGRFAAGEGGVHESHLGGRGNGKRRPLHSWKGKRKPYLITTRYLLPTERVISILN